MSEEYTLVNSQSNKKISVFFYSIFLIVVITNIIFAVKFHHYVNLLYIVIAFIISFFSEKSKCLTKIHEEKHAKKAKSCGHEAKVITDEEELEKISRLIGIKTNGFTKFNIGDRFSKKDFIIIVLAH